jgi:hypothetical protein
LSGLPADYPRGLLQGVIGVDRASPAYPLPITVFPSSPAYTYLKQHLQPLQIFHQKV